MPTFSVAFIFRDCRAFMKLFDLASTRGEHGTLWRYDEVADRPSGTSIFRFERSEDALMVRSHAARLSDIRLVD